MTTRKPAIGAAIAVALLISIPSHADSSAIVDLTSQMKNAVHIDGLSAVEVGGIVILRGKTTDLALAQQAGVAAQNLGYSRVANLIQVVAKPDDAAIERVAERQLAMQRALDGCKLRVGSNGGVLTVAGKVTHELQKDLAVDVLRQIHGVRSVKADFQQ
jgi:osmotically-inducible protein OsmY